MIWNLLESDELSAPNLMRRPPFFECPVVGMIGLCNFFV